MPDALLMEADALRIPLADGSVQTCVTSPPYFGLRNYGVDGQIGLEQTPEEYVAQLVTVFREVWRVLRDDGTCWINLGDSYAASTSSNHGRGKATPTANGRGEPQKPGGWENPPRRDVPPGLKPKDLLGIPWLVARALQEPYYTGRIRRERDRVWLAAMIDGEGTICGFDHTRADDGSHRSGVHVAITNTSTALLDEAARIWPTSRSSHQRAHAGHLGTKDSWRWIVHGIENKMAALAELYPYLIAKRQQAVVGYTLLTLMADAKRLGHSSQKDAVLAKRLVLTGLLSDLNHQRPVTLPAWLIEPPPMTEPGWYLRSEIIWHKPNPMPESVTDRPTKAHEQVFLLAKSSSYFYDADAIREPSRHVYRVGHVTQQSYQEGSGRDDGTPHRAGIGFVVSDAGRNRRTVWTVPSEPCAEAHFAVMPTALVEPCILAGCPKGGLVLDPFAGSGTVGVVALRHGRRFVGLDLNREYLGIARDRLAGEVARLGVATPDVRSSKSLQLGLLGGDRG